MPRHALTGEDLSVVTPRIAVGPGSLAALAVGYNITKSIVALGRNAMAATTASRYGIAIGPDAMKNSIINRDDIAIGESALREIQALTPDYDQAQLQGTRMIAIGGNAGLYASSNYNEVLIGRNASQCKTSGWGLVAIGPNALAGHAQYGLATPADGGDIINNQPWGNNGLARTVAIGYQAMSKGMALLSVAIGGDALANVKASDDNVAVGILALAALDTGTGIKGGVYTGLNISGSYAQATTTITITATAHTLAVGNWVYLRLTSGAAATYGSDQAVVQVVSVSDANTFTVTSPISRTASGTALVVGKETSVPAALNSFNTAVGSLAGSSLLTGVHNTLVGKGAASSMTDGGWNTVLGSLAGGGFTTNPTNHVIIGYAAYSNSPAGGGNVAVGASALRYAIDGTTPLSGSISNAVAVGRNAVVAGDNGVAVGYQAKSAGTGVAVGNGASTGAFANATAIGNGATGTADNQITLGNASIAQIRAQVTSITALSDERDKTDIEDTPLGLEFIKRLRPVDYRNSPRSTGATDPTLRHGFLAQDVLAATDELGASFGGVDDSDPDNLAMNYSDLIAPLVRAVKELSAEVTDLRAQLANVTPRG